MGRLEKKEKDEKYKVEIEMLRRPFRRDLEPHFPPPAHHICQQWLLFIYEWSQGNFYVIHIYCGQDLCS